MKNNPWKRLTQSARPPADAPPPGPAEMPFGFDTRALARLRVPRSGASEVWARLALRAVPLGAAALVLCWLALPTRPPANPSAPDEVEQLMQEVLNP